MMKSTLLSLICALVIIRGEGKSVKPLSDKKAVAFDEVIGRNNFGASGFGGTWISASEFTYTTGGNLTIFNVTENSSRVLLTSNFSQAWSGASLRLSPDQTKVLVRYQARSIFRHSTVARFAVVLLNDLDKVYNIDGGNEVQICTFSTNGDSLIYIRSNTIFYVSPSDLLAEKSIQISPNGEPGVIYHGIPDWVYEEEVLGSDAAAWISHDGKYLAYASFDDTDVETFTYEIYGDGKGDYQYPEEVHLKYPKVGSKNPKLGLTIQDVETPTIDPIILKNASSEYGNDHILGSVFWISNTKLGVIWTNRRQNHATIVSYSPSNPDYEVIMKIDESNGWIELNTPKCEDDGYCYFINNNENWPSLTRINTNTSPAGIDVITHDKHVLSYYGSRNSKLFYLSTPAPDESFNRHLYEFDTTTSVEKCISCDILTTEGNKCTYVSTSFSTDLSFYALTCSGPDPAIVKIYSTGVTEAVRTWQLNEALRTRLEEYALPRTEIFHIPVEGGFQAAVKMLLPPEIDFDNADSVTQKYPMLVRVYGGPGSVRINSAFAVGYQGYQVTTKKYIYVEIDGRGTGQKGVDMMFSVNNRLGTYEMDDQISVTKALLNKYKFIDPARVTIWGWSYGGYATAMTLAKDTEMVFKCGVSVAPVTSWIFYDTIYTERYMGFEPYAANYNNSDVSTANNVEIIGKHQFMLVHGNADDNVHYQQSMVLARALEVADIMFDQVSYPDEAHGLSGVSLHLYHSLDRFWDKCFK